MLFIDAHSVIADPYSQELVFEPDLRLNGPSLRMTVRISQGFPGNSVDFLFYKRIDSFRIPFDDNPKGGYAGNTPFGRKFRSQFGYLIYKLAIGIRHRSNVMNRITAFHNRSLGFIERSVE